MKLETYDEVMTYLTKKNRQSSLALGLPSPWRGNHYGTSRVLSVTEAEQTFTFIDLDQRPLPSLLRGFSAPVRLGYAYTNDELAFLLAHDSDPFNRWKRTALALNDGAAVSGQRGG